MDPFTIAGLGLEAIDLGGKIFGKSNKEIRQQQIREYLKRRAQLRDQSLARLSEETGKNIGRINQYTTGTLQRTQGDLAARSASRGRGADEADFLAAQGKITGQGSEAIQNTQDAADRERRRIQDQYEQDVMNAESEGIFAPENPSFTDILGSLASPVLQYGLNREYLDKMNPNTTREISTGRTQITPTGISEDIPYDIYQTRQPVNISNLPQSPPNVDYSIFDGDRVVNTGRTRIRNIKPFNFMNQPDQYYSPMRNWRD